MKYALVLDVAKGKSMFMLSSNVGEVLLELVFITKHQKDFLKKIIIMLLSLILLLVKKLLTLSEKLKLINKTVLN